MSILFPGRTGDQFVIVVDIYPAYAGLLIVVPVLEVFIISDIVEKYQKAGFLPFADYLGLQLKLFPIPLDDVVIFALVFIEQNRYFNSGKRKNPRSLYRRR